LVLFLNILFTIYRFLLGPLYLCLSSSWKVLLFSVFVILTFNTICIFHQVEEKPDVTYSDVGGCKEQIDKLREVVETPLLHVC